MGPVRSARPAFWNYSAALLRWLLGRGFSARSTCRRRVVGNGLDQRIVHWLSVGLVKCRTCGNQPHFGLLPTRGAGPHLDTAGVNVLFRDLVSLVFHMAITRLSLTELR